MNTVLRNFHTNDLYLHIGGNEFENIRTGKRGLVDKEKANTIFKLNVEATMLLNEYPEIKNLIKSLDLKIEK